MQDHVAETALAAIGDLGHAGDFMLLAAGQVQMLQLSALLGNQQAAVGQEGHRPRLVEAADFGGGEGTLVGGGGGRWCSGLATVGGRVGSVAGRGGKDRHQAEGEQQGRAGHGYLQCGDADGRAVPCIPLER
ncbi:hypothetical protein G6F59_013589 [Rhizopus arrhizus]|nr:hypothetical protein G6F59_013589 [Rhizopus arrhizus]